MEENKKEEVKGTQEKKKLWETLPVSKLYVNVPCRSLHFVYRI